MSTSSTIEEQQITLKRHDNDVCVITLTGTPHKANVFDLPLLQHLDRLLTLVEQEYMPCTLIIRGQGNKFFSAGFDLQALTGSGHRSSKNNQKNSNTNNNNNNSSTNNNSSSKATPKSVQGDALINFSWQVLNRLLVFPAPTICLLNGHAFGLGLFLALACDYRIMMMTAGQKGGTLLCLPEITIGLPLGSGFAALAKCKLTPQTLRTAALTGKQFTANEAFKAGIVDGTVPFSDQEISPYVLKLAKQLVTTATKGNLSLIKQELYHETQAVLLSGQQRSVSSSTASRSRL